MFKAFPVSVRKLGRLEARARSGHKGTFGTVCVVGGCCRGEVRYLGAPALVALGALRSGCGLCRVLVPEPLINHVLGAVTSATGIAVAVGRDGGITPARAVTAIDAAVESSHALVVGPGMGGGPGVDAVVRHVWGKRGPGMSRIHGPGVPLVLDADGLNALAGFKSIARTGGTAVVTPHPGEAKRLMKATGVGGDPTDDRQRARIAIDLSHRLGAVVVLKGARTVVSDGVHVYRNASGGQWLATGGTGDVLAGVIGGLIAQHVAGGGDTSALFRLACIGVLVHGRAGDAWARERGVTGGMLAAELAERVAREVERMRK